jgi:apolipoprotein N-acyltransferase
MASEGTVSVQGSTRLAFAQANPGAEPTVPRVRALPVVVPALAGAGLLWLSFFPVAWGWLAWFSLVPLLVLVRWPGRGRTRFLVGWLAGLAFYWPALQWLRVADPRMYFTWAMLATYSALYVPLTLILVRGLDRRTPLPLVVTLPVAWTAVEMFRACFIGLFASALLGSHRHDVPGGFSWYLLGYTQHNVLPLIQIADLGGVYAVTFLVCAVNALLFEVLFARAWFRRTFGLAEHSAVNRRALLAQGLAVLLGFTGVFAYGVWRLGQDAQQAGPRIALVQGDIDQRIRIAASNPEEDDSLEAQKSIIEHYGMLTHAAALARPDLVIWPETSYPDLWEEVGPGVVAERCREGAAALAQAAGTTVLFGANGVVTEADGKRHPTNSAVQIDRRGRWLARYDKTHRVPFGEYVPLRQTLPLMNKLAPYDFEYSVRPGREFTRFGLPEAVAGSRESRSWTFGVVICYEDTVPEMARPYVGADGKPPADFLLNISNDGWFDGTSEHDEHLAICRFRAIECRRSVARAVNMGISALIDSNGRVLRPEARPHPAGFQDWVHVWQVPAQSRTELPLGEWHQYKKVAGVLLATVPIDSRTSLYGRWGNWLPWSCWGLIGVAGAITAVRRRSTVGGQRDGAK